MEELIDLIATDGAPSDISDKIKSLLYAKAGENIDYVRPEVASAMFGDESQEHEDQE